MKRIDRWWWLAPALLAVVFGAFEFTSLDLAVQDRFYDISAQRWAVDREAPVARFWFYDAPKVAIIALGVTVLVLASGPARWRRGVDRRALWVAFATLATVPILIGAGKSLTNTFCPSEIRRYGGDVPYVKVCSPYPENDRPARRGRCFPAGHASGGFALLGLIGLARTRRGRWAAFGLAMVAGWAMGGYQMAKGAHFLSHTLVTMLVAWAVFVAWRWIFGVARTGARMNENSSGVHVGFMRGR